MLKSMRWIAFLLVVSVRFVWAGQPFTVVSYNVENLFDVDGIAAYDDFQSNIYTPAKLSTKIANISAVLSKFNRGAGPDIVFFQEIEFDQSRNSRVHDYDAFLKQYKDKRFDQMLAQQPLPAELAGLPSEAWLLKALYDNGMKGYQVIVGDQGEDGPAREGLPSVKCVIFSRFAAKSVKTYPLERARDIVEACVDVNGYPLYLFDNHWKSGAGDPNLETVRVGNAEVLRHRVDELLKQDPQDQHHHRR